MQASFLYCLALTEQGNDVSCRQKGLRPLYGVTASRSLPDSRYVVSAAWRCFLRRAASGTTRDRIVSASQTAYRRAAFMRRRGRNRPLQEPSFAGVILCDKLSAGLYCPFPRTRGYPFASSTALPCLSSSKTTDLAWSIS